VTEFPTDISGFGLFCVGRSRFFWFRSNVIGLYAQSYLPPTPITWISAMIFESPSQVKSLSNCTSSLKIKLCLFGWIHQIITFSRFVQRLFLFLVATFVVGFGLLEVCSEKSNMARTSPGLRYFKFNFLATFLFLEYTHFHLSSFHIISFQ
jgi:hypothetical protein